MPENKSLIPIESTGLVAQISRGGGLALRGRNDLRSNDPTPEQKRAEKFFRRYPKWFIASAERYYKLSELQIAQFEDRWDWRALGENEALPWSETFIDQYFVKWDLGDYGLWGNRSLPLSDAFIEHFPQVVAAEHPAIPWTEHLIARYQNKLFFGRLSKNKALPWSGELIEKYKDAWDWECLSRNTALPLSEELIEKYKDAWVWHDLSRNTALPFSEELIEKYKDAWDWRALSGNTALPLSEELIEKYKDAWDWRALSSNGALPWSEQLFVRFEDLWDWMGLSSNPTLPWSDELYARFKGRWNYQLLYKNTAAWSDAFPAWGEPFLMDLAQKCKDQLASKRDWRKRNSMELDCEAPDYDHEILDLHDVADLPWTETALSVLGDTSELRFIPTKVVGIFNMIPSFQCAGEIGMSCFNLTRSQVELLLNDMLPTRKSRLSALQRTEQFFRRHPDAFIAYVERYHGLSSERIAQYEHRWNWCNLSSNELLPWTTELLAQYKNKWDWKELGRNTALPWSKELIRRYKDRWDWKHLYFTPDLPWATIGKSMAKRRGAKVYRDPAPHYDRKDVTRIIEEAAASGELDELDWKEIGRVMSYAKENFADQYIDRIVAAGGYLRDISHPEHELDWWEDNKLVSSNELRLTQRQIELLIDDCLSGNAERKAAPQ